jgi:hypothetical protein
VANTLAYYGTELITTEKSFIVHTPQVAMLSNFLRL